MNTNIAIEYLGMKIVPDGSRFRVEGFVFTFGSELKARNFIDKLKTLKR